MDTENTMAEKIAKKKVLILTIDGGGIRGILPAYFLSLIEAQFKNEGLRVYQLFDVIGGTSTGGMLAIGLTTPFNKDNSPKSAHDILGLYLNDCDSIFRKNHQLFGPKYYADPGIEPFLKFWVSPTGTLAHAAAVLPNKKVQQVFATTYVLNSTGGVVANPQLGVDFGPYLFNWFDAQRDGGENYYLWEVIRATSSAPVYYPIANVGGGKNGRSPAKEKWAVDGGVMSADPSVWGVTESLRTGIATSLDDMVVISLGCGIDPYEGGLGVTNEAANHMPFGQKYGFWGALDWELDKLKNLNGESTGRSVITGTSLTANQFVSESQLVSFAKGSKLQYHRVQLSLPANLMVMDNCTKGNDLLVLAQNYYSSDAGQEQLNAILNVIRKYK